MYLDFFSLKKFPFRITPDPSMFFPGGSDGPGVVLNALVYAVTSGEGIVKVVGEVGSGKTMLCRMLEEKLPDSVEIVYLANPSLSAKDIIYAIAFELELDVDASTERLMVMHKLQDYLVKKHSEGGTVVVFIEEAQGMPIETLEEIRLLSNLETHRHKLMQIILFGQPELDKNLQGRSIRQLRERITHSFYLEPMTLDQTSGYLQYRMQAAGCPWPKMFTNKAEKLLNKASQGLTRRVNILADKSLMAAYASSSIQAGHEYGAVQQKVLPRHVKAAIRDSGYGRRYLLPWLGLTVSLLVLALAFVSYNFYQSMPGRGTDFRPVVIRTNSGEVSVESTISSQATPAQVIPIRVDPVPQASNAVLIQIPSIETPVQSIQTETENALSEESVSAREIELPLAGQNNDDSMQIEAISEPSAEPDTDVNASATELTEATEVQAEMEQGEESSLALSGSGDMLPEAETVLVEPAELTREIDTLRPESGSLVEAEELSSTVEPFAEVTGLTGVRARSSGDWLQALSEKSTYTLQMASFATTDQQNLEEYLQLLSLASLIDETYLCLISGTRQLASQWLVMHGDFSGLSGARTYINNLPDYSRRYEPFVRNSGSIACLTE